MRILVVEDEEDVASFIRLGLAAENFAVDCAFDGSTALSLVTLTPYDAIVLDLMLPKKGGLEILRELRTKDISTPVVVLSGLTDQATKIEALTTRAADNLT